MKIPGITLSIVMMLHSFILRIAEQKAFESEQANDYWTASTYSKALLGIFLVPEQASVTKVFQKDTQEKIHLLGIDLFQTRLSRVLNQNYNNIYDFLCKRSSPLFIKILNLRL
jgi:hypothetical protein